MNQPIATGQPIIWKGDDLFTHMLVVGATRSGKTATILKPLVYQLLLQKKRGKNLGISVIEPKGDLAGMVAEMAHEMGLEYTHIDPTAERTSKFNPMEGDIDTVAEATVIVLKGLFGKQEAFFATVQELSARNVTKLLKELNGDKMDIIDVLVTLRDPEVLKRRVQELKARDGETDLVHFFESELLGTHAEKYRQFVIGLRAQLENIVSNSSLRRIMTGKSDIDIDEHFEKGGILAVNTALGMLGKSGDAFGQFIVMHLQNGTFRRKGTEKTRVPHFLIVDEYSRYINPEVERFLSLAAEYRVAGIFATQSLSQLEVESGELDGKAVKRTILTNCRNKIVFGGLSSEDAKEFAEEFGKDRYLMRQSTYKNRILIPRFFPEQYRDTEIEEYRFTFTDIMDGLPRFHFIHKLMVDGEQQPPGIAKGNFVPRNWKELREWEQPESKSLVDKLKALFKKEKDENEPAHIDDVEAEEIKSEEPETTEPQHDPFVYAFGLDGQAPDESTLETESSEEEKVEETGDNKASGAKQTVSGSQGAMKTEKKEGTSGESAEKLMEERIRQRILKTRKMKQQDHSPQTFANQAERMSNSVEKVPGKTDDAGRTEEQESKKAKYFVSSGTNSDDFW